MGMDRPYRVTFEAYPEELDRLQNLSQLLGRETMVVIQETQRNRLYCAVYLHRKK
jgi:hypothetical protein